MIKFYCGPGSSDVELKGYSINNDAFQSIKINASRILLSRNLKLASDLLRTIDYILYDGTNCFNDTYQVLVILADVDEYTKYSAMYSKSTYRDAFQKIAIILDELQIEIRFIIVELKSNKEVSVDSPVLENTNTTVESALNDCMKLIASNGSISGVDRIFTAFHGYLKAICINGNIQIPPDANTIKLYKLLQQNHPAFSRDTPLKHETAKISKSIAVIIDALAQGKSYMHSPIVVASTA